MSRPLADLTGNVYGRLTALRLVRGPVLRWECQCKCGRLHSVRAVYLLSGRIRSCGCQRADIARERAIDAVARARHSS